METRKKSIIDNERRCHICGSTDNLHKHHVIYGWANRKLSDEDGLWLYLCMECHMNLHDYGIHNRDLQIEAEEKWIQTYGTEEEFRKRYGKSYF